MTSIEKAIAGGFIKIKEHPNPWGRKDKEEKEEPFYLTLEQVEDKLEDFYHRPLFMESSSLFSRDRVQRGVCFHFMKEYTGKSLSELVKHFGSYNLAANDDMHYAFNTFEGTRHIQQLYVILETYKNEQALLRHRKHRPE